MFKKNKTKKIKTTHSAEGTIKSRENQRTVYSDKDRHNQNDTSRGTILNSATALWDDPTTPLLHITVPPGGSSQTLCSQHNSQQTQCESRISLQRLNFKFSVSNENIF